MIVLGRKAPKSLRNEVFLATKWRQYVVPLGLRELMLVVATFHPGYECAECPWLQQPPAISIDGESTGIPLATNLVDLPIQAQGLQWLPCQLRQ